MNCIRILIAPIVFFAFVADIQAGIASFDNLTDGDLVTNQYPSLTFTNTIVFSAGISLNEFEFPPHSESNVASDNGGPITILFSTPVTSVSGFFTYLVPLNLIGFDASDTAVASATSAFQSNLALSGDPGSSPNELLTLASASGISRVTLQGDPGGGSFVLDDLSYTPVASTAAPEPSTGLLAGCVLFFVAAARWAAVPRGARARMP
jgi:hypothetical protein